MKQRNNLNVDIHDVDFNGIARLSSLMQYIQSAAQAQLNGNNMSYDQLKAMNRVFVLSKIRMEFSQPVRAFQPLVATTFPCESHGYSFLRCYTLESDEQIIGKAISVWALIDTETKSLVRVNNFQLGLTTHAPLPLEINRFIVPRDAESVGIYTVNYDDVDQNGHMNNTKYPDMYSTFLPLEGMRIRAISINFINEAVKGAKIDVRLSKAQSGAYYFRTVLEDGKVNTEAEIWLEKL